MRRKKPNLNGHLLSNGITGAADRKRGLSKSRPMTHIANKMADCYEVR